MDALEDRACRDGVAEQGDSDVPAGEALAHDARANHGGEQKGGAKELRTEPLSGRVMHRGQAILEGSTARARPMSSSRFCNVSMSSERSGKLTKMPIL